MFRLAPLNTLSPVSRSSGTHDANKKPQRGDAGVNRGWGDVVQQRCDLYAGHWVLVRSASRLFGPRHKPVFQPRLSRLRTLGWVVMELCPLGLVKLTNGGQKLAGGRG